ncbi:Uncharacterized protein PHSC3_000163 [Chlamydiales bacterium STE3]|nr:Uncharacterized protein PHSC3_000163 [Chlamydiales bacterium STE3]
MSVFALADLHLSLGNPEKKMDFFGEPWTNYTKKIEKAWQNTITDNDLVLIAGDISWATHLEDAKMDLDWIHQLPGTKVLIKGNHDYWWSSLNKIQKILPPSLHLIQNNAFHWKDLTIGGARLWDTQEYNFDAEINFVENPRVNLKATTPSVEEKERIFERELQRLEISLKCLKADAKIKIAMTHYPPIATSLKASKTSILLEKYGIDICLFGHLHNVKKGVTFGKRNGINYLLTSADYLNFQPLKIL